MSGGAREQPMILIVDDCDAHYELYSDALASEGYQVTGADDGREAIERARRAQPDLIIMDLGLPILDGCQATRQLKADSRTAHIPILMLTGYVQSRVLDGARAAGCDALLTKPCSIDRLVGEVLHLLGSVVTPYAGSGVGKSIHAPGTPLIS